MSEVADIGSPSGYTMRGLQGRVIEAIGKGIVSGRYRPGELLPKESELAAEYDVSRTSVREAMKVLSAKGLVEIRRKIGTRVRAVDLWNTFDSDLLLWFHDQGVGEPLMRDLVEMRQVIEPMAARLAASRASMADLRSIERAQQAMIDNARDHSGYSRSDVEFHMALYTASHNSLFARFGHLVADFMQLSFEMQQKASTDSAVDFSEDAAEHAAIYHAINRGDAEAAADATLAVVLSGKQALSKALSDNADTSR